MCGIAGFYGQFDQDLLKKMSALINHRGPDASGNLYFSTARDLSIGFSHTRLSIIDLSDAGKQPMTLNCQCCSENSNPKNKYWLTFNGEIYNFKKLRTQLESKGHSFFSNTDSEVLLHLYREYGHDMLKHLNGIFAFAIYDPNINEIFLARDQLGVKPLYFSHIEKGFLFASELKALLACAEVSREIDPEAVQSYLSFLWAPAPQTMLKSIQKLQPGYAMIVREGKIHRLWQHYDIPMNAEKLRSSFNTISSELAVQVEAAVARQMVSDVPVGAFLSGGLDSSSIVAMMRKLNPETFINCYTIRTQHSEREGFSQDLPYAEKVARHLNVKLNVVDASPDMIRRLPEMLYYLDEPQADPAPINALLISELARKDGVKVLMSGAGGDDLFTGYRRHAALYYDHYWQWLPLQLKKKIADIGKKMTGNGASFFLRRFSKLFSNIDLLNDKYLASFFYWNTSALRNSLFSSSFQEKLYPNDRCLLVNSLKNRVDIDRLERMLYLEVKHFLADHNLNYTDKASMAMGVEVRVPLLDLELVDFASKIASNFKQKGRIGKAIFKKSMEPYLPKEVIYRPKTGFGAPLRRWLHHELNDMLMDCLSAHSLLNRGIFDPKGVQQLIKLDRERKVDGAYTIYSLLNIELWCRQFIDPAQPRIIL